MKDHDNDICNAVKKAIEMDCNPAGTVRNAIHAEALRNSRAALARRHAIRTILSASAGIAAVAALLAVIAIPRASVSDETIAGQPSAEQSPAETALELLLLADDIQSADPDEEAETITVDAESFSQSLLAWQELPCEYTYGY